MSSNQAVNAHRAIGKSPPSCRAKESPLRRPIGVAVRRPQQPNCADIVVAPKIERHFDVCLPLDLGLDLNQKVLHLVTADDSDRTAD